MSCSPNYNYEKGRVKVSDYSTIIQPTWCGGCGDYGIWASLKRALAELDIAPHEVLLCFDIGCNGNMSDKIKGYRIHTLHGRVLPVAAGAKLANPNVKVIAFAGDGATYSEGINHFINSIRSNYPITLFVHNNGNYGLTTGQASATTKQNAPRNSSPNGPTAQTLNPLDLAFALNPSFVARGFSGNIHQLTEIMKEAIMFQDKGFAYVDILQACPTFNKETTHEWYMQRVRDIKRLENYTGKDLERASRLAKDLEKHIATGVLYKNDELPNYFDRIELEKSNYPIDQVKPHSVQNILKGYI